MARAYTSTVIAAPIDKVWDLLSDFGAWHRWCSRIRNSTLEGGMGSTAVGAVRLVDLESGGRARERLVAYDAALKVLSYDFPGEIPFPVRSYLGTVKIYPVKTDGTTFVEWFGDYDADAGVDAQMRQTFIDIYNGFFEDLKKAV